MISLFVCANFVSVRSRQLSDLGAHLPRHHLLPGLRCFSLHGVHFSPTLYCFTDQHFQLKIGREGAPESWCSRWAPVLGRGEQASTAAPCPDLYMRGVIIDSFLQVGSSLVALEHNTQPGGRGPSAGGDYGSETWPWLS